MTGLFHFISFSKLTRAPLKSSGSKYFSKGGQEWQSRFFAGPKSSASRVDHAFLVHAVATTNEEAITDKHSDLPCQAEIAG